MAQTAVAAAEPNHPPGHPYTNIFRKLLGKSHGRSAPVAGLPQEASDESAVGPDIVPEADNNDQPSKPDMLRRGSRKVVPGLPRAQTFKRQQSEKRMNLAPIHPTPDERRAVSVDRRGQQVRGISLPGSQHRSFPRTSAPELIDNTPDFQAAPSTHTGAIDEEAEYISTKIMDVNAPKFGAACAPELDAVPDGHDARSVTTSQYDDLIHEELERKWILNLSMHFRDKSKREKFFVTYRETESIWRRVTVSLDYRNAPQGSLELDLSATRFQRDKSAKIYEAIRESLQDIQFYESVTNLKLQTTGGRLHVHVVEDTNEIINYPPMRQVEHLGCRRIRESDIVFDAHMSGFVYRVKVSGETLIKKEIPGPETVDEFLYEINALHSLRHSADVIRFYGVVIDDQDENVKGLLISYADQGALVDVLYDNRQESGLGTPWPVRERWARQIVQGLAEIHECGFVQGDFTLSNIVIDDYEDAKIIDINRRGCPVGWEPPEATPLIESGQRLSMYIGVKSDLFQLGMVLWALATQEDEPEIHERPLRIPPTVSVPDWFRRMVDICLSDDPRQRVQASSLLSLFPEMGLGQASHHDAPASISVDDGHSLQEYFVETCGISGQSGMKTTKSPGDWPYMNLGHVQGYPQEPHYQPRGRSPPSPLSSHYGHFDTAHKDRGLPTWAGTTDMPHSYSDADAEEMSESIRYEDATPTNDADVPAVFVEKPGGIAGLPLAKSGVLTPESLAVEHHLYHTNDMAKTPTPRAIEGEHSSVAQASLQQVPSWAPASVPLPLSPPIQDSAHTVDTESIQLQPVPDDLTKLDHVHENGPSTLKLVLELAAALTAEHPPEPNQSAGDKAERIPQTLMDPADEADVYENKNRHAPGTESGPVLEEGSTSGVGRDNKKQVSLKLPPEPGLTAPGGETNNSNNSPSNGTDLTGELCQHDGELPAEAPKQSRWVDAITSKAEAPEAAARSGGSNSVENTQLEGVGAVHQVTDDRPGWEKTLSDNDFDISTVAHEQPPMAMTTDETPSKDQPAL